MIKLKQFVINGQNTMNDICSKTTCVHWFLGNCRRVLQETTDNHVKKKSFNGMKISTDENKTWTN